MKLILIASSAMDLLTFKYLNKRQVSFVNKGNMQQTRLTQHNTGMTVLHFSFIADPLHSPSVPLAPVVASDSVCLTLGQQCFNADSSSR